MKKKWWILSLLMLSLMMMGSICVVHAAEEEKTYYCVIKNQNQVVLSNSPKGHVAAWITLSSAASSKAAEGMSYTAQTDQLNITGITAKSMTVYCSNLYIGETACNIGSVISKDTTTLNMPTGTHLNCSNVQGMQLATGVFVKENKYYRDTVVIKGTDVTINGTNEYTYTGYAINPTVSVKINGKVLESGRDYTVSYADNINVGTGKIYITGQGDYTSEKNLVVPFTINPLSIKDNGDISITVPSCAYNGQPQKPSVTVKFKGKLLKNGTDYTFSYLNNINAGTASVTVKGIGNYKEGKDQSFTIQKANPDTVQVQVLESCVYSKEQLKPKISVKLGGYEVPPTQYTVGYGANKNAGKDAGSVTVNFCGTNWTKQSSCEKKFTISKAEPHIEFRKVVNKLWFTATDKYSFEGEATGVKGAFTYSSSNKNLVSINKTTGKVKVKEKNTFGTVTITATFTPINNTNYKKSTIEATMSVVPNQVAVEGKSPKAGTLELTWKNGAGLYNAKCYRVYMSAKVNGAYGKKNSYGTVTKRQKTITGLAKGKYCVVVVPIVKIGGKEVAGEASTKKEFTVK